MLNFTRIKNVPGFIILFIDLIIVFVSIWIAFLLRFNFEIPDDVAVLFTCIEEHNIDALNFFLDKSVDKNKKYFDETSDSYITPLTKALNEKYSLTHYLGSDSVLTDNDLEVKKIDVIIHRLNK